MRIILLCTLLLLNSCAYYSINIVTPDGTKAKGRAIVLNESDDVILEVNGENFTAKFGKQGTDAGTVSELVSELAETLRPGTL